MDETTSAADLDLVFASFASAAGKDATSMGISASEIASSIELPPIPAALQRTSLYMTHPIFNTHHSEHQVRTFPTGTFHEPSEKNLPRTFHEEPPP